MAAQFESIVVGAGCAGLMAARRLQKKNPSWQILVLEAEDRAQGRSLGGLHLVDAQAAPRHEVLLKDSIYESALVRWDREWKKPDDVNWTHKDWATSYLPQWETYLKNSKRLFMALDQADVEVPIKYRSPVKKLTKNEDGTWTLETPEQKYHAGQVVWACGLSAFQNAFGKQAAQNYMVANPLYKKDAADFRGGIALDLVFEQAPQLEEGCDPNRVFALPLRHESKLYLMLGVLDGNTLKVLLHTHQDLLAEPKEVLSMQKSIRRALRQLTGQQADAPQAQERWVVHPRVSGHVYGSMWVFGNKFENIEFIGDESLTAQDESLDILGALSSVDFLTGISTKNSPSHIPLVQVL